MNEFKILSVSKNVTSKGEKISLQSSVGSSLPFPLIIDALHREREKRQKEKRRERREKKLKEEREGYF
jgi:hypothetical protein